MTAVVDSNFLLDIIAIKSHLIKTDQVNDNLAPTSGFCLSCRGSNPSLCGCFVTDDLRLTMLQYADHEEALER
jgi:hypothetical protein